MSGVLLMVVVRPVDIVRPVVCRAASLTNTGLRDLLSWAELGSLQIHANMRNIALLRIWVEREAKSARGFEGHQTTMRHDKTEPNWPASVHRAV